MREDSVKRKIRAAVKRLPRHYKAWLVPHPQTGTSYAGMPDYQLFMDGGRSCFIEAKGDGGRLSRLQIARMNRLRTMGFYCFVVDPQTKILNEFILTCAKLTVRRPDTTG